MLSHQLLESLVGYPPMRYDFLHDMQELHVYEESIHVNDPTNFEEALLDKDFSRWLEAMRAEMDSMYANQVYERNQAMQHTKAKGCAKKGEIQKFHLHSSSSNEEFLAQDPICN